MAETNDKDLTRLVEGLVHDGATTAEEIHRAIADLPITVLEGLGVAETTTREVRRIQDMSIGAIYGVIRDINHKVADLAEEVLEKTLPEASSRLSDTA